MSFASDLDKFSKKAKGNMTLLAQAVAMNAFRRVIFRTPVDTGRARGNWICGVNTVPSGYSLAADDADEAASAMGSTVKSVKYGDVVTLVNNLPYIRRLEHGYSNQAPAGMVQITAQEFNGIVGDAAQVLNR